MAHLARHWLFPYGAPMAHGGAKTPSLTIRQEIDMGQMTDERISAWQHAAGIEPATGAQLGRLEEMQEEGVNLIRIIELERSGIRDGDGSWHGSDPLSGVVRRLSEVWQLFTRDKEEPLGTVEG